MRTRFFFFLVLVFWIGCTSKPDAGKITATQKDVQELKQTNEGLTAGMDQMQKKIAEYDSLKNAPQGVDMQKMMRSSSKAGYLKEQGEALNTELETLLKEYTEGKIPEKEYEAKYQALKARIDDHKNSVDLYLKRVKSALEAK